MHPPPLAEQDSCGLPPPVPEGRRKPTRRRRHGRRKQPGLGVGARRAVLLPSCPRNHFRPLLHLHQLVRGVEGGAGARPACAGDHRTAPEETRQAQAPQPRSHRQVLRVTSPEVKALRTKIPVFVLFYLHICVCLLSSSAASHLHPLLISSTQRFSISVLTRLRCL